MKKILILLLIFVSIIPAKTRWATTRFTPTADLVGAGRFVANYNIFLNTEHDKGMTGKSLGYLTIGASEWFEGTLGYADGFNFAMKGRILNEYTSAAPSLAIGVRNMFYNETLARSRLDANQSNTTGELFMAFGKSSSYIQTRFHGGVLSLPHSDKDWINGFAAIEKYFGDDFYLTFEGFSQQKKFYLALTASVRFMRENRGEIYFSLLDLQRMFITQNRDFGVTLTPNSRQDWIKPGIVAGLSFNLGGRQKWIDGRAQFRTIEDNFAHHDTLIKKMTKRIDVLEQDLECLNAENETMKEKIDSLINALELQTIVVEEPLPLNYAEVLALVVSYAQTITADRFDPRQARRILGEIGKFGTDGIDIVARIAEREPNRSVKLRAITILGELQARDKIPLLLRILDNTGDNREKVEVITALGKINERSVRAKIEEFSGSADSNLQVAANEVLERWRNSNENIPQGANNDVFSVEPRE